MAARLIRVLLLSTQAAIPEGGIYWSYDCPGVVGQHCVHQDRGQPGHSIPPHPCQGLLRARLVVRPHWPVSFASSILPLYVCLRKGSVLCIYRMGWHVHMAFFSAFEAKTEHARVGR